MSFRRITIIKAVSPRTSDINEELQWLGGSLGLFSARDKDKSCFRIFIALIRALKNSSFLSSDKLAEVTGLTRGTVVHHLNSLMDSGLVENDRRGYKLKVDNLQELVDEVELDVKKTLEDLKDVARNIDNKMGLN